MPDVYVARRRLRVGGRDVMPGQDVPEANTWRHLSTYVHNGSLALVQTGVTYARGMHQLRPTTGRDDYRTSHERWYGEVRYGGGAAPGPSITSLTPTDFPVGSSKASAISTSFTLTGHGLTGMTLRFPASMGPGIWVGQSTNVDAASTDTTMTGTIRLQGTNDDVFPLPATPWNTQVELGLTTDNTPLATYPVTCHKGF